MKELEILKNPEKYGYVELSNSNLIKKNSIAIYTISPRMIYTCYYVFTPNNGYFKEGIEINFYLNKNIPNALLNDIEKYI